MRCVCVIQYGKKSIKYKVQRDKRGACECACSAVSWSEGGESHITPSLMQKYATYRVQGYRGLTDVHSTVRVVAVRRYWGPIISWLLCGVREREVGVSWALVRGGVCTDVAPSLC